MDRILHITLSQAFWENTNQDLGRPCQVSKDNNDEILDNCPDAFFCDGSPDQNNGYGHCNHVTPSFWDTTDQELGRPCQVYEDNNQIKSGCKTGFYCDGELGVNDGFGLCHSKNPKHMNQFTKLTCNVSNFQDPCPTDYSCKGGLCVNTNKAENIEGTFCNIDSDCTQGLLCMDVGDPTSEGLNQSVCSSVPCIDNADCPKNTNCTSTSPESNGTCTPQTT